MKIGDNVLLRGTIKGVTYGEYGFPYYLVTLPNGCETEFPKLYIENSQQLDEPQKVKVPQFVADFIAEQKRLGHTLSYSIDASMSDRVAEWYWDNSELFALAWIFGYEVEEEKRYLVKIRATKHYFDKDGNGRVYFSLAHKSCFTKKTTRRSGLRLGIRLPRD